jgi:hypothetical protein
MNAKIIGAAFAVTALLSASPALASKRDSARTTLAAAEARISMNDKTPMSGRAAEIQARASAALAEARLQWSLSKEDKTIAAATEAGALADLAAATQQKQAAQEEAHAQETALAPLPPAPVPQ